MVPRKINERCRGRFTICAQGLECRDNLCELPFAGLGDECFINDAECDPALRCRREEEGWRCVEKGKEGEACGRGQCAMGLRCAGGIFEGVCTKEVGEGDTCIREGESSCMDGMECVMGICEKRVERGGRCGGKRVCRTNLICEEDRCIEELGVGDECGRPFTVCRGCKSCAGRSIDRPDGECESEFFLSGGGDCSEGF